MTHDNSTAYKFLLKSAKNNGFSLVELSIVLVIIGLLTGGILSGQSLIRAAELRSVTTEYAQFNTATMTFRDKYLAVPGDMKNATKFWGKLTAYCNADAGTASATGTCSGDGDGLMELGAGALQKGENLMAWNQLALQGLFQERIQVFQEQLMNGVLLME